MMRFDDLIGKEVLLGVRDSELGTYRVVLRGVETGGVWFEGEELDKLARQHVPKVKEGQPRQRPVFFFPYQQIVFLMALSVAL
jgi:hypothetical protein